MTIYSHPVLPNVIHSGCNGSRKNLLPKWKNPRSSNPPNQLFQTQVQCPPTQPIFDMA
ncbi:hypothetical protein CsatA_003165 [Cannabis sativa]